jgi:hypothetical protein
MTSEFNPAARQIVEPALAAHVTDLFAARTADPGKTFKELMSPAGYENCHCKPLGKLPDAAFRDNVKATLPP